VPIAGPTGRFHLRGVLLLGTTPFLLGSGDAAPFCRHLLMAADL